MRRALVMVGLLAAELCGQVINSQSNIVRKDASGNVPIGPTVHSPATSEPACDASKRGHVVRVEGGAGVADTYRECVKTAADTYAWQGVGGSGALPAGCSDSGANGITCTGVIAAGGFSTGDTPPSVTPGTGGVWAPKEGTAPSVGAAAGVDVCYADSTANAIKCSFNNGSYYSLTRTIYAGTKALDTDAIASTACDTMTQAASGVLSTDVVTWTFNADVTGVTGYVPATAGGLAIYIWPSADTINIKVCNPTADAITPQAASLNLAVRR